MATYIKQPNGGVLARVRIQGYPPVSRQFKTKVEAREWAGVIEGDMRTGAWRDPTSVRDTLLRELIKEYVREVVSTRRSPHCVKDETLRLNRIGKALGEYSLAALNQQCVAAYRDARLKKVAPATVSRELSILAA